MKEKKTLRKYLDTLRVKYDKPVSLKKDFDTHCKHKMFTKEDGDQFLHESIENMAYLQDVLYASKKHGVLIVLQAMDAAGKDGAIKHVMTGLNPQGVKVSSFKSPNSEELNYDYLWRHYKALPGKGEIRIFNRSHYENVLVTRVHPEFLLMENILEMNTERDIDDSFWEKRYRQINQFEKTLTENGTIILKFFLHLSKDEQKARFLDRINDESKNWKFSESDVKERGYWNQYTKAYEEMLRNTSTDYAPWYVLPADDKWFTRLCLGSIINLKLESLKMSYPAVTKEHKHKLEDIKNQLLAEE